MDMISLKEFFSQNDQFAKENNIILEEIKEGYAKTSMKIGKKHLNAANVVHGGAIFTLADFAFAIASNTYGTIALSINSSISFINGAKEGEKLYAVATEIEKNFKLGSYTVTVTNDDGKIIAIFQGMVYRKDKKFL
jgi:acyl-CoA thioesterase